jgi:hypothetical protein
LKPDGLAKNLSDNLAGGWPLLAVTRFSGRF